MIKYLSTFIFSFLIFTGYTQISTRKNFITNEMRQYTYKTKFKPNPLSESYDIIYHRSFWNIDPAKNYISGSVCSYFRNLVSNNSKIVFDLSNYLNVDSIIYHSEKIIPIHENNLVQITLPKPLLLNQIDSITIFYKGSPYSDSGFGTFVSSTHNNNDPVLWTLSEPYGAKDWWPCKQSLTDKIDSIDIFVQHSSEYKAASNGVLISEKQFNSKTITHWKHRHPIASYLVAFAVSNYKTYSDFAVLNNSKSVEILNYVYPENLESAKTETKYTIDVIELLSEVFIPYPFWNEKYGHAQFGWGGGMEHQTISFMVHFNPNLIAHELAHQWFGDFVTCSSWHDIWVNEGFAVFCENIVMEHLHPDNWLNWKKNELNNIINKAPSGSVWVDDITDINRIFSGPLTYTKGGFIIHMLRNQIGDSAFFCGIKEMLTNPKTAYGFADAGDVKNYLEQAADTNLSEFFNDWYYGEGYPEYRIKWHQETDKTLKITINQTQTHYSVSFFEMHLPFIIQGESDQKTIYLHNTKNEQTFSIALNFEVSNVIFDPELNILTHHKNAISPETIKPFKDELIVKPNPVKNTLYYKLSIPKEINSIYIYSDSGKKIMKVDSKQATDKINISTLHDGFYVIKVKTKEKTYSKRFVISN